MTTDKSSKRTVEDYGSKSRDELIDMVKQRDSQVAHLIHQIDVFRRMQFGPRTEKQSGPIDPKGLLPFPSLKALLDEVEANAKARAAAQLALKQQTAKTRTPRGPRSQFPEHLPRLRRAKELSKEELTCSCGCLRKKIREEKSQRLERIAVTYVEEIVTIYYACAKCETVLASKPDAPSVIEGGLLGPNFLAELIHDHFGLHLPYSRIEKKLGYEGLELSRSVLCSSVLRCGELLRPIYDALVKHVLSNFLVRVDETPVVIRNGNAKGRKRGFFWIYGSQDGCTFFDLRPDRGRASPEQHLAGFRGFIQADAFAGYDFLFKGEGEGVRTEIGCWAHMRRKFFEASTSDPELWQEISAMLCVVFEIERQAKGLTPEARYTLRMQQTKPILDEIRKWIDARILVVNPQSQMFKAIQYARNHWTAFTNFLRDGRIEDITNNAAERALRAVALGRKNWMFVGTEDAGRDGMVLMSLISTCKQLDINPIEYLRDVLLRIAAPGTAADPAELTPKRWKENAEAKARVQSSRTAIAAVVGSFGRR